MNQRTVFLYTAMLNGQSVLVSFPSLLTVTWSLGLVWHNRLEEALTLCQQMTIKPDHFILTILFDICGKLVDEQALEVGRKIFSQMEKIHRQNAVVMASALNMFMRNTDVKKAEEVFHSIRSKNHIMFGAMMKGYNMNDLPLRTLSLVEQMKKEKIEPDQIIYVLACHACSQIGMIDYARSIVAQIPTRFLDDSILQNTLIDMWASAISITYARVRHSLSFLRAKLV